MIQVKSRNSFSKIITLSAAFMFAFSSCLIAQDAAPEEGAAPAQEAAPAASAAPTADAGAGEALFKANCAACHKLYANMTGPMLHEVSGKYPREFLYKWIKNSQAPHKIWRCYSCADL